MILFLYFKRGELIKTFMRIYNTFLSLESWDFNLNYFLRLWRWQISSNFINIHWKWKNLVTFFLDGWQIFSTSINYDVLQLNAKRKHVCIRGQNGLAPHLFRVFQRLTSIIDHVWCDTFLPYWQRSVKFNILKKYS